MIKREQQPCESVTAYFDDKLSLCREYNPNMVESLIVHHLIATINPQIAKQILRSDAPVDTLGKFWNIAKTEDLNETYAKLAQLNIHRPQSILLELILLTTKN
ncbi:unnamed protein product [Didymodactylos carnosus]|uniref:Uncharacterized protein n=1 Tax=Didymodactylos carnosus TaxID=1234261 RepID=A0A814JVC1_9BILA|nr:unnamed protein product [Didymodactylos carnosus]CAF1588149.1 unnamed protein product [Didymodactylos carnosus]CAF3814218.1 unnamed protein product [Didymodactylos carnosus]CAF4390850.1 unnamed protein product [Didymodactylos carnosus]